MTDVSAFQSSIDSVLQIRRKRRFSNWLWGAAAFLLIAWCFYDTIWLDTEWSRMGGLMGVASAIQRFLWVDWSLAPNLIIPTIETVMMATLGTLFGCVLALPVAWFGAYNVTPSRTIAYPIGRMLMVTSRSIHEIIWALLFVAAVGLGALAGILAIAMRSIGFISKITAEAIENIDAKPVEAIRAVGGNQFQVMWYGIIPQILPVVIGTLIFEWDINIRRSAVMGLVGAGGLGLVFFRQMAQFNFGGVTMVIIAVLLLIMLAEIVSHYARKAII